MHRRDFLKALFGVAGAVTVVAAAGRAEALPLAPAGAPATPTPAVATDKDVAGADVEKAHWRAYPHRHRAIVRRRRFWRRRRW